MAKKKKKAAKKATKAAGASAAKKTKKKITRNDTRSPEQRKRDKATVKAIEGVATTVLKRIEKGTKPDMSMPVRSLSNVEYSTKKGYFEIGKAVKVRTLTVNTVKTFAQSLKMMALSKELIETNNFATKREAYYTSKNWRDAKFREQPESDTVMDDIEAMFSVRGISREALRYIPAEHGGAVAGS